MRYTKDLQANVCDDIRRGLNPQQCAEKYGIPVSVVLKWNDLKTPVQRAKEIALRKYQVEVSEAESDLTNKLSGYFSQDITDDDFTRVCKNISDSMFALSSKIVQKERDLNPHDDPPSDAEIIGAITRKWQGNPFLKKFGG